MEVNGIMEEKDTHIRKKLQNSGHYQTITQKGKKKCRALFSVFCSTKRQIWLKAKHNK
jgi:hypothetical protein